MGGSNRAKWRGASGKVDAVRLPKEIYFAHPGDAESETRYSHLGALDLSRETRKTVYVVANTQAVELFLNGKSLENVSTARRWIRVCISRRGLGTRNSAGRWIQR